MLMEVPSEEVQRLPNITVKEFFTEFKPMADGNTVAVDYARWTKRGDLHSLVVVDEVARLRKPLPMMDNGVPMENPKWTVIKAHYEQWKAGQDIPLDGTPLGSWSMLSRRQVEVLREMGYRTVEDLAAIEDSMLSRVRLPDPRIIRDRARQMLEVKKNHQAIAEIMAPRDAEIADLKAQRDFDREQRESDRAMIARLSAALEALQAQQVQQAQQQQYVPPPRPSGPPIPAMPSVNPTSRFMDNPGGSVGALLPPDEMEQMAADLAGPPRPKRK